MAATLVVLSFQGDALALANSDTIRFLNPAASRCLHVRTATENRDGGLVTVQDCRDDWQEQKWVLQAQSYPVGSDERFFRLRHVSTGRCLNNHNGLNNRNGGRVTVTSCTAHFDQQWQLTPTPKPGQLNTRVQLRNRGTDRCLNLNLVRDNTQGGPATVFDCADTAGQSWRANLYTPSLRIYFQNMALVVPSVLYKGRNREKAIGRVIEILRKSRPAVVGLAEVFADGERERIAHAVADIYPIQNMSEGSRRGSLRQDSGLLMLSRYPVIERSEHVFRACRVPDCFARKGILRARIQFPSPRPTIDIYLTHLQDPDATDDAFDVTLGQVGDLHNFVRRTSRSDRQAIVMGDFNVDALSGQARNFTRLAPRLMDLWTRCDSRGPGITLDARRDFERGSRQLAIGSRDVNYRRTDGQRVDYMLQFPATSERRLNCSVRVAREQIHIQGNGWFDMSDHYGLMYTLPLN